MTKVFLGGKERTFHYGVNALRALEEQAGGPLSSIMSDMQEGELDIGMVQAIVWAGLLKDDRNLDFDTVGDWMDDVVFTDVANVAITAFSESIMRMFPSKPVEGGGEKN